MDRHRYPPWSGPGDIADRTKDPSGTDRDPLFAFPDAHHGALVGVIAPHSVRDLATLQREHLEACRFAYDATHEEYEAKAPCKGRLWLGVNDVWLPGSTNPLLFYQDNAGFFVVTLRQ